MQELEPHVVFSPHSDDRHPVHIEAHSATHLALNQFLAQGGHRAVLWVQTEFWHPMLFPNLLIPYSREQVIRMGEALLQHAQEVARNPYHLRLPAWLMDSIRRGSEVVAGAETLATQSTFGQIYFQKILASN